MKSPSSSPNDDAGVITDTMYSELRRIAHRVFASERRDHTLQPTAVVNEACIRLLSGGLPELPRAQQLAIGARVLRQVLIDHARARNADKRGGGGAGGAGGAGAIRLDLDRDILAHDAEQIEFGAITEAMDRLRALSERQAEVVTLRLFAGMTMEQIASVLDVSKRTVESDWAVARAWLRRELSASLGEPSE